MMRSIDIAAARLFAVTVASAVGHVTLGGSTVGVNLWILSGWPAAAVALFYATVLTAIAIDPDRPELHITAAPASALFWLGRMGGFVDLAADGRPDLWPAVHERAMLVVVMVAWHVRAVQSIAYRTGVGSGG